MSLSLSELCAKFSRFSLADNSHNAEILDFISRVSMTTKRGNISASRGPDYFALGRAQGERSFVVLMRNDDGSLGGVAGLSVSVMLVKGKATNLVYASDLRLSDALSRRTRLQFHAWYEELALRCSEIEEFGGSAFMVTSIFDENSAAVRALVDKKKVKREPIYRPFFPYQNINVVGRWRAKKMRGLSVGDREDIHSLREFLLSNPEGADILWTEKELTRRLEVLGLGYSDFLVAKRNGVICGVALPFADESFRRTVLRNLNPGIKCVGRILPLLGKPGFREGTPLRNGFLGFLKIRAGDAEERADVIASLLAECLSREKKLPRKFRCHTITVMDAQDNRLEEKLKRRGFLFTTLPATIYQVVHRKNFTKGNLLRPSRGRRPDFEVGLA